MASVRKREWGQGKSAFICTWVDANGKRHAKQFARWREADAHRKEVERQLAAGTFREDADKKTVAEVCEAFLQHCEGRRQRGERMSRHSLAVYRGHVRNHVLSQAYGIGRATLARLDASMVGDFRDDMRNAGVSVPTTRKILSTLHGILQFAIGKGWLAINAAHGIRVIGRRDEGSKKVRPPTKEAVARLLAAADEDLRAIIWFAVGTGVRAGELWALRWRHLDLGKREVTIETRVDCYRQEDTTKTAAGVRQIPLGADLVTALKAWRVRSRHSQDDDLVFTDRRGGYVCHANFVKRRFRPLVAAAGVHVDNWHSLRHHAVSTWIDAGLSPKTVQTFAGHSTLEVTMSRYGHLFRDGAHQAAMDRIAAAQSTKMQQAATDEQ
jgi:integrase